MAKANTKKVGGANNSGKDGKDKKDKKEKKVRTDFAINEAKYVNTEGATVSAVNEEGLLIAVPKPILGDDQKTVVHAGWDNRKHKPLKKVAFASMATFLLYQGFVARIGAQRLIKIAEAKEAKGDRLLKFGDESTRKKAEKVAKMREQLAKLEEQLTAEGVDVKKDI